jgi:hypothetical protein
VSDGHGGLAWAWASRPISSSITTGTANYGKQQHLNHDLVGLQLLWLGAWRACSASMKCRDETQWPLLYLCLHTIVLLFDVI